MKKTINTWDAKREFESYDRDYYSMNGIDAILEYYDEIDENMEFDVIAICCDCTEFGDHGAALDFDSMISDYGYLLNRDEWMEENEINPDEWENYKDLYIEDLVKELEDHTTVLHVCNGNYIVFEF
jgi:hypothetical protein